MKALKANINYLLYNQLELQKENNAFPLWNRGYQEALEDVLLLMSLPEGTSLENSILHILKKGKK
jgi:hypothetical protein